MMNLDQLYQYRARLYHEATAPASSRYTPPLGLPSQIEVVENLMIDLRAAQFRASAIKRGDTLDLLESIRRARLDLFGLQD